MRDGLGTDGTHNKLTHPALPLCRTLHGHALGPLCYVLSHLSLFTGPVSSACVACHKQAKAFFDASEERCNVCALDLLFVYEIYADEQAEVGWVPGPQACAPLR